MRGLRIPRLALPFFTLLSTCTRFAAGQANRTVDDFSPLIAYSPADAVTHLNTTGFEVPKLYNGTIAIMNTTTVDQVNMTLKFTGTGIWLFLAKPVTPDGFGTGYDIVLDGVPVGSFASFDQEEDAEYGDVAFSNDTLPLGAHTIQLLASGMVYFDYARFTSNDPTPETTIPPVAAPTSSASASATSSIKSKETSQPASSPSTSATAAKSKSHVAAIAGAAAGVLLLIGGACLAWMLLRRRRPAGNPAQQYASGPQNPGPYGGAGAGVYGGQGDGPYGAQAQGGYSAAPQTSEAALLRMPTSASHHSQSPANSFNAAPPLPAPQQFQGQYPPDAQHQYAYARQNQNAYQPQYASQAPPQNHGEYPVQYAPPAQNAAYPPFPNPFSPQSQSHSQPQPQHQHQAQPQYDAHGQLTYAYDADPATDADMARVMAEQRAVEAEYARPDPDAWGRDEKAALAVRLDAPAPAPGAPRWGNLSPAQSWGSKSPGGQLSPGAQSGGSVSPSGSSSGHTYAYPPSPASGPGPGDPALTSIAAEMRALRAQVARLEGGGHPHAQEEMVPPPAYD